MKKLPHQLRSVINHGNYEGDFEVMIGINSDQVNKSSFKLLK